VLDATHEELGAGVTLGPQLHDERPVRGQRRFVHRLERSGPLLHVRIDTARAAAVSVKNPKSSRKFGMGTSGGATEALRCREKIGADHARWPAGCDLLSSHCGSGVHGARVPGGSAGVRKKPVKFAKTVI
jgi:hypothetical protein